MELNMPTTNSTTNTNTNSSSNDPNQPPQDKLPKKADAASKLRTEGQDFLDRLRESSTPAWIYEQPDMSADGTSDNNSNDNDDNDNRNRNNNRHRSNMSSLSADIFEHEILNIEDNDSHTNINNASNNTTTTTNTNLSPQSRPPSGRKLSPDKLRHPTVVAAGAAAASSSSSSFFPPKPPPLTLKHGRKVSWGKDYVERREHGVVEPTPPPPQQLYQQQPQQQSQSQSQQQSNLIEKRFIGTATTNEWNGGDDHPVSSSSEPILRNKNNKNHIKLTLDDVLKHSPYEDETETGIVYSADEGHYGTTTTNNNRGRSDTGTSTIFTNVPDLVSHDFEISHMPTFGSNNNSSNNNMMDIGGDNDDDDDEQEEPTRDQRSNKSGQDRSIHTTAARQHQHESRPLMIPATKKKSRHQRHMSVEQTLMSLTDAMSAVHGQQQRTSSSSSSHRHHHRRLHTGISIGTHDFAHDALSLAHYHHQDASEVMSHKSSGKSIRGGKEGHVSPPTSKQDVESTKSNPSTSDNNHTTTNMEVMPRIDSTENLQGADIEAGNSDSEESLAYSLGNNNSNHQNNTNHHQNSEGSSSSPHHPSNNSNPQRKNEARRKRQWKRGKRASTIETFKEDWELWSEFFRPRRKHILAYIKYTLFYFLLPAFGIAAILFYLRGNPTKNKEAGGPSSSYILLFCCRQVITFSMALAMQAFVIDFICLGTKFMLRLIGPVLTLLIVQSKGWPHILFWWAVFDFTMMSGAGPFAQHWAYYQKFVPLLNAENPSGNLVSSELYFRILTIVLSVSLIVSVKRFAIGLYLGRQTFSHYGLSLAEVMNKMLLVSKVASLAKEIEDEPSVAWAHARESIRGLNLPNENSDDGGSVVTNTDKVIDLTKRHPLTGSLNFAEKLKLMSLLEQWEEPVRRHEGNNEIATISAVLRFRKALAFIQHKYPFSHAFGPADSREACIDSAQEVYARLVTRSQDEQLQFETLALIALGADGEIDQAEAKALIKIFRPDRKGGLTMLDFVKSIDAVYKEFRLLAATIENSSQIDRAFEGIFNVIFYCILVTVILSQLGFNPLALFLSLSSVILAFAFMIGNGSSKYFEGVLFILVRRPYGIGDYIQVGGIETNGSLQGALPWCVANVTLFETELVFVPTNERASLSNGSLANCRIINWARSPQAQFFIFLEFPIDTPYYKLEQFKVAVEEYIKARPREWRALNGFRVNNVYASRNYIEHNIVVQHREAWQHVGQIFDSKANLTSYCQEVARELGMEYKAPILPVEVKYTKEEEERTNNNTNTNVMMGHDDEHKRERDKEKEEALVKGFQFIARQRHRLTTS